MIHAKQIEAINALIFVEEEVSAKVKSYLSDAHRTRRKKIARRQRRMVRVVTTIRRESTSTRTGSTCRSSYSFGAGGASGGTSRAALYALHQTGLEYIYLVDRTRSAAVAIASNFRSILLSKVLSSNGLRTSLQIIHRKSSSARSLRTR